MNIHKRTKPTPQQRIESGESSLPNGPYPSTNYGRRADPSITLSAYALAGGRKLR